MTKEGCYSLEVWPVDESRASSRWESGRTLRNEGHSVGLWGTRTNQSWGTGPGGSTVGTTVPYGDPHFPLYLFCCLVHFSNACFVLIKWKCWVPGRKSRQRLSLGETRLPISLSYTWPTVQGSAWTQSSSPFDLIWVRGLSSMDTPLSLSVSHHRNVHALLCLISSLGHPLSSELSSSEGRNYTAPVPWPSTEGVCHCVCWMNVWFPMA